MGMLDIAKTMKIAREHCKFSQQEVAEKLGVSYQAISNYERGINKIDSASLGKLCAIYGLDVAAVLKTSEWEEAFNKEIANATNDCEKTMVFEKYGPCPEYIYEYQTLMSNKNPATENGGGQDVRLQVFTQLSPEAQSQALDYMRFLKDKEASEKQLPCPQ